MKRLLIVSIVLLLVIGLSGCGEDLAKGEDSSQVVKKTSADKKQSKDFREMIAMKSDLTFMVEYDVNVETQGQTMRYDVAQYLGAQDTMRMDTTIQGVETRTYFLPDGYYSCNDRDGWQCMKVASAEDIGQQDFTKDFDKVGESPDDYDITYKGTKSVAGTTAHCWGITYAGQVMEQCFSSEGVPLYMEMTGPGMEYVMKATSYSTKVSSDAFDLPAKAQDMEKMVDDMMKQYEGQMPEGYEMPDMGGYE